ncbi:MAG: RHS repeat-associated core domain-containing protein, partial [Lentisphaeria bacterium]|nr:RHS repeat-associated core domain-containing protein [Lentisphaeria bacterium]
VHNFATGEQGDLLLDQHRSFLLDELNATGYAQVLEEWDTHGLATSYTIGDDVLSQTTGTETPLTHHFLYDGHGNTRALTDTLGTVAEVHDYDVYGNELTPAPSVLDRGGDSPERDDDSASRSDSPGQLADLRYCGEPHDTALGMNYLRARYYSPATGLFNRQDPAGGNPSDPQSYHKYAYCHNDPANNIDPTGLVTLSSLLASTHLGGFLRATWLQGVRGAVTNSLVTLLTSLVWSTAKGQDLTSGSFWKGLGKDLVISAATGYVTGAISGGLITSRGGLAERAASKLLRTMDSSIIRWLIINAAIPGILEGLLGTIIWISEKMIRGESISGRELLKSFSLNIVFSMVFSGFTSGAQKRIDKKFIDLDIESNKLGAIVDKGYDALKANGSTKDMRKSIERLARSVSAKNIFESNNMSHFNSFMDNFFIPYVISISNGFSKTSTGNFID